MRHSKYKSYNSYAPFGNLIEDFFNKSIGDIVGGDMSSNTPSVNTYETETAYIMEVAAPGIEKENIKIELEKNQLIISSTIEKSEDNQRTYKRREFDYSNFSRRFQLKDDVNLDKVKASHNLGVLTITLPKLAAEVVKKKTSVNID